MRAARPDSHRTRPAHERDGNSEKADWRRERQGNRATCAGGTQARVRAEAGAHHGYFGLSGRRGRHPWPADDAHGAAQPAAVTRAQRVSARAAARCNKVGGAGAHVLGRGQYLRARSRSRERAPRAAHSMLRRAAETRSTAEQRLKGVRFLPSPGCQILSDKCRISVNADMTRSKQRR